MLNMKYLATTICLILFVQNAFSQLGFSHEIGVIAGPVEFRSDFGQRYDERTNLGNSGFGIGLVHYINFAYRADCNCYSTDTYFNDHFKLRSEISYNYTKLDHFGKWVQPDRTSLDADRLRAQHGVAENLDVGMQLEYFPLSIRSFQAFAYRFAPFVSLGVHWTSSSPQASSDFGNIYNPAFVYQPWVTNVPQDFYPISEETRSAWSMVTSVGVRYKLTPLSDLMLDLRWQLYFDDWIDGLNHTLNSNKYNDWLVWLNFGYIYYLD